MRTSEPGAIRTTFLLLPFALIIGACGAPPSGPATTATTAPATVTAESFTTVPPTTATTTTAAEVTTTVPLAPPAPPAPPAPKPTVPKPTMPKSTTPKPDPQPRTDPRFGTCKEAKSKGYGPYYKGVDVEYGWYRDADSDGIVCE
ncbi:excalibur calcium-binding domain-containing protein [Allokutzneria albata]|uniref:Excalibur calcium-binding domain-containing protein n=1 Tax=Allokutzneria albata TaxID=211114 RepID=A0A1G9XN01_ALLAB|nr:excalibur calcium-binding domain-containing protein [Allokutzneria albata]SDM97585.1 Excalibur calcium-binding domain-containing protein [Allokutzneria albata]